MTQDEVNQQIQKERIVLKPGEVIKLGKEEISDFEGYKPKMDDIREGAIYGKAYLSASTTLATVSLVKLPFDLAELTGRLKFDSTNNRFYIYYPGIYVVHAQADFPNANTAGAYIRIDRNGSQVAIAQFSANNTPTTLQTTTMLKLTGRDYIEAKVYLGYANGYINGSNAYTFMTITRLT